jgi:ribonucleoside-diphosphate reductase alpha chain
MEHRFVAEHYYGKLLNEFDIHHINGDSHDNRIVNLQVLPHHIHSCDNAIGNTHQNIDEETRRYTPKEVKAKKTIKNTDNKNVAWYVTEVVDSGEKEAVYNMTVDEAHNYIANGILVANCGEEPLLPYESCNLGSINLGRFIKVGKMDYDRLGYVVELAVRFLDNVIDVNKYAIPQIETKTKATRKIGLGVMGFADMLIKMGIMYDSDEAVKKAHEVMGFIQTKAVEASVKLAQVRGVFPLFRGSVWHSERNIRLRNAALTMVAPTGTLSIIGNCSSGIEPYYSKSTKKHILNTILEEDIEFAKEDCFITAHDISPEWHVRMQSAFQAHVDGAVSKTINFPNSATVDDVKKAYLLAYKLKCKGITIYRDGSRQIQVLTSEVSTANSQPVSQVAEECPACKKPVIHADGCVKCSDPGCGWSACKVG